MEDDFANKRPPEEGTTPVPIISSREVHLQLPNYQEDFTEIDANIKETRICRNRTLAAAITLFGMGMVAIIVLAIFTIIHFTPAAENLADLLLKDVIGAIVGALTTIGGGALFKYYQSLQQDLQAMWNELSKLKQDQKNLERIVRLLGIMKNEAEKDRLIAEVVRSIVRNITGN